MKQSSITNSNEWKALCDHWKEMEQVQTRTLFEHDPERFRKMSLRRSGILFDYSKNKLTKHTIELLVDLAKKQNIEKWRDQLFSGGIVNSTENRAALHTALRSKSGNRQLDGGDQKNCIDEALQKMDEFVGKLESGQWSGYTGKRITDVVNIGIGGSDLGPKMVTEALRPFKKSGISVHFISNIDGSHLVDTIENLNPETTLFIVASKSFVTDETLTNAKSARSWLLSDGLPFTAVRNHFVAVSSNITQVEKFGIHADNVFPLWDWVGGRYSLWSSIGLPIAVSIGMDHFYDLLQGANEIDEHFRNAELSENIPVLMALIGIWYHNFGNYSSHAILPYDQHLKYFADYLQQTDMESNGKSTRRGGKGVNYSTAPIVWGSTGTDGQHAYFQLLHQGTERTTCDFIVPVVGTCELDNHHNKLLANCIAQTEALMVGSTKVDENNGLSNHKNTNNTPHKQFSGDRPSNTLLIDSLLPRRLGALIALYEHKTFVQGVIWDINSFDQWGVELGKVLAEQIFHEIEGNPQLATHDSSTKGLISHCVSLRQGVTPNLKQSHDIESHIGTIPDQIGSGSNGTYLSLKAPSSRRRPGSICANEGRFSGFRLSPM